MYTAGSVADELVLFSLRHLAYSNFDGAGEREVQNVALIFDRTRRCPAAFRNGAKISEI